ncbi:MAG: phosphatase PAP2 family protein [Myxococcota bacterium]
MKAAFVGAVVGLLAGTGPARAQSSEDGAVPGDVFEVELVPDIGATLAFVGLGLLLERNKASLANDLSCPGPTLPTGACSAETVNPIDRWATSMGIEAAAAASDVLLLSSLTAPLVFSGLDAATTDRGIGGGERFGRDTVVVLQTYAATYFATNVLKVVAHRLRPFNYDPDQVERRRDGDSRLSFPSGHTSMAFAGAASLSSMLDQRYPAEPWAIGVSVAGFALASAVGINRVLAGRHFPSDVLAGAALGTTLGLLIPLLHRSDEPDSGTSPAALTVLNWGGRF